MSNQLGLFCGYSNTLNVPAVIRRALDEGGALGVSISGGKDGQAMLSAVSRWFREQGYTGQLFAIHADLGRAEWPQTPAFVEQLAEAADVPLIVVRRQKGDLVARIEERLAKIRQDAGGGPIAPFWPSASSRYCTSHLKSGPIDPAPFWPSSGQRYCTSDLKRGPIDTELRRAAGRGFDVIISAEGVRRAESKERAKKPVVEIRQAITSASKLPDRNLASMTPDAALSSRLPKQRVALDWRPIFDWSTEQVWQECGTSSTDLYRRQMLYKLGQHEVALAGWPAHPAYVMGNTRLSCALCVLGSKGDLLNGANHNPDLYRHYLELEIAGQATFKNNWSLFDLPVTGRAAELKRELQSRQIQFDTIYES